MEVLLEIRQEMSREADYDVDLFAEMVRSDKFAKRENSHRLGEEKDAAADVDKTKIEQ